MFIYSSDRSFSVVSYNYTHGLLLLRSGFSNKYKTRIDILFQDVIAIESRMYMQNLEIREVESSFLTNVGSCPEQIIEPGHKVFSLIFDGGTGFIIGRGVGMHKDEKQFSEPSFFVTKMQVSDDGSDVINYYK